MQYNVSDLVGSTGTVLQRLDVNPIVSEQYDKPKYPLYWKGFKNPVMSEEWFKDIIETAKFEKSHFGINTEKEEIRVYDDTVRLSYIYRRPLEQIQQSTIKFLSEWGGQDPSMFQADPSWNILRYIDGHFSWHKDKVRPKKGFQHLGTQIVLPPLEYSRFEEGELVVLQPGQGELRFKPVEGYWIYLVLPLGYFHCVEKVVGTRISFTKQIYFKRPEDQPKTAEVQPPAS